MQGSEENYIPPEVEEFAPDSQAINNIVLISKALESYYAINLNYPQELKDLVPDYLNKLPKDPVSNKDFIYETDLNNSYVLINPNPNEYNLSEIKVENGKLIKK